MRLDIHCAGGVTSVDENAAGGFTLTLTENHQGQEGWCPGVIPAGDVSSGVQWCTVPYGASTTGSSSIATSVSIPTTAVRAARRRSRSTSSRSRRPVGRPVRSSQPHPPIGSESLARPNDMPEWRSTYRGGRRQRRSRSGVPPDRALRAQGSDRAPQREPIVLMGTTAFLLATFAVPGMAIGSFSNVVVSRLPLRLPIGTSRSRCMGCSNEIAARDNIPILSFLLLRGRCRSCGSTIPWRYPAVEAMTAVLVALCGLAFGLTLDALVAAPFCAVLVVFSAIEIEHGLVPDRLALPAVAVALVAQTALHPSPRWAVSALAAALCLAAAAVNGSVSTGRLGLAALLGAVLGPVVVVALIFGYAGALALAAVSSDHVGRRPFETAVPLAPFLSASSIVALLVSAPILAHSAVGL